MATSFKALRQYEKIGLVILAVVVMIFFTMGDFFSFSGRSGNDASGIASGTTLVTWKGGSLTRGQIDQIGTDHRAVIDVEQEILQQIALDKKNPGQPKVQPIMEAKGNGELINRYIFSTYAHDMGLQVDDEAVRTFLKKLSGDRMGMREIKKVLDDVVGDTPEARARFFAWMKRELASKAVERMILSAQSGVAPDGTWDQFRMMMQRAEIQFLALPTINYMDKVKDKPSPAELKSLYEELKSRYRLVDQPDSGVRRPEEVGFEWVKADINTYLQDEKKKVTDEQVKEYYEKNKTNYKKPKKPPVQPPKTDSENKNEPEAPDGPLDPEKEEPKPQGDTPAAPEKENAPSDPKEPKPEGSEPEKTNTEPAKEPDPAGERQSEEPQSKEPKAEDPPEQANDAESVSLVSLISQDPPVQDPPVKEQEPAKPATDPRPAQGNQADPAPESQAPAEKEQKDPPAQTPAGQEKPAEDAAKPEDEKAQETPAVEEDEFRPLEEVADNIRTDLASKPAEDRYNKALTDAEAELRALWKKVNLGEGNIDQAALRKFDLTAFAAKYQFTSGTIPLNPPDVVKERYELGKFGNFIGEAFFSDKPMLYEPRLIKGNQFLSNEAYIYWRTEQKEEYEPTYEECEEELKNADRYRKAKQFAREDAKDKASQVKEGQSLKEAFPKENVLVTGQFSYKTPFSQRVGEIPEIPGAGEAFLSEVFKLKTGQVKEIPLADESQFYVVYLTKYASTDKELRDQFANFPIVAELARAADAQLMETRYAVGQEFLESLDVKVVGQENSAADD